MTGLTAMIPGSREGLAGARCGVPLRIGIGGPIRLSGVRRIPNLTREQPTPHQIRSLDGARTVRQTSSGKRIVLGHVHSAYPSSRQPTGWTPRSARAPRGRAPLNADVNVTSALPARSRLNERFQAVWQSLLPIGREPGTGGYRRYAWNDADRATRRWFQEQAEERGLAVERHASGNLLAWWDGAAADRDRAVLTGSHLDSVPDGGAFDGPLGVVSALCAVDLLREKGVAPKRALAVAVFTDEEGARFGLSCVGSRLLSGLLDPQTARELCDADGITLGDAMLAAEFYPNEMDGQSLDLSRFSAFVELHIEQGRGLVDLGSSVGLATAIWPHGRWRCSFRGEANHAGTTRLVDRCDPMLPFAATALAVRGAAAAAGALATCGRVSIEPNATNGVPSAVHAWLDARAPDHATLERLVEVISAAAVSAANAHGVTLEIVRESYTPEVRFETDLRILMARALRARGLAAPELATGAGHDAGILSASMPTGMIFVRNPTGVSHSPAEHAELVDCLDGVDALAAVLEELLCR